MTTRRTSDAVREGHATVEQKVAALMLEIHLLADQESWALEAEDYADAARVLAEMLAAHERAAQRLRGTR